MKKANANYFECVLGGDYEGMSGVCMTYDDDRCLTRGHVNVSERCGVRWWARFLSIFFILILAFTILLFFSLLSFRLLVNVFLALLSL